MAVFKCSGNKRIDDDGNPYCTYEAKVKWRGPCPGCGRLYDITRFGAVSPAKPARVTAASLAEAPPIEYIPTGVENFDKAIGGGLVKGSTILFGGSRGVGKSSLLMAVADGVATAKSKVLYASGEQSSAAVGQIVQRMGVKNDYIEVMGTEGDACDAYAVIARAEELKPRLIIIDSLHVMTLDDIDGGEGSPSQVVGVTNYVTAHCQRSGQCSIVVAHMNGQGDLAGGQTVQHLVETLLMLDREYDYDEDGATLEGEPLRALFTYEKNRNGPVGVRTHFEMSETGLLKPVRPKTKLFTV